MAYMNQSNAAEKRLPQVEVFERPEITALPENRNIKKRVPYFRYGLMTAAVFVMLISMLTISGIKALMTGMISGRTLRMVVSA